MGCGANLKVTAISQPTNKKDHEVEERQFRVTRFKFKLPAEVLQGLADVLQITARKSDKRRRPQVAEPSEVSMDQLLSSQASHQPESSHPTHQKNHRFSLPDPVPPPEDVRELKATKAESLKPQAFPTTGAAHSMDASPDLEVEDLSESGQVALVKQPTIEAQVLHTEKQQSMFTRVEERELPEPQAVDDSGLLSPEAPRVLPDEEENAAGPDLSAQRFARQERDKEVQGEAERLAQAKRQQAEVALEAQKSEMAKMEGAAQSILSKYQ